jgi:flagellar hook assembly protein FlgD
VELEVFDLAGRMVWTRRETGVAPGPAQWAWSGRDARGARVPKGLYFARLQTSEGVARRALVRL